MFKQFFSTAAVALMAAGAAQAVPVMVASYDMPNGSGKGYNGQFNYWDLSYNGSGNTNVDAAPLSGGVGDLTDGVVASDIWINVENEAGTGPYVGWQSVATPAPEITFNFDGVKTIHTIRIHMDNSNEGGVVAPLSVLVNGNLVSSYAPPALGTIGWTTLSGLSEIGDSLTLTMNYDFGGGSGPSWIFVSEVAFEAVPEPGTWAMLIAGFGLVGMAARRRQRMQAPVAA